MGPARAKSEEKLKDVMSGFVRLSARTIAMLRAALLAWYDAHRRDLPWRQTRDPYAIWVSEIMLQQTRVAAVLGRYEAFLERFPTVGELARASEADVLTLWSGLGYYRRARNLHRGAQVVAADWAGKLPASAAGLRVLPGVGAYTSAAIASIAFGEAAPVVDGNVERVIQRLAGIGIGSFATAAELGRGIDRLALTLLDPQRPGDFNQAMMELGATVCLPRNPQCLVCPLRPGCRTRGEHGTITRAKMRSEDAGYALAIRAGGDGQEVLLEQRPLEQSVMPGMWELPRLRECDVPKQALAFELRHAIMQVNYRVRIRSVDEDEAGSLTVSGGIRRWVRLEELAGLPLTGLARKALLRARLMEGKRLATV
jgi:A/G-specific adenine glycosylase